MKPQRMTPRMQFNALDAMSPDDGGSYPRARQATVKGHAGPGNGAKV
jgi:hypothetical protein